MSAAGPTPLEPARAGFDPRTASSGYRYLCVGILALAYTFNFLDRQILSLLAEPVRRELHLSDTQIGLLTVFAFALFYTLCGLPIAWFADRSHRVRIIAAACACWSLFSAASGLAGSFLQLAVARMGVGIGEAGGTTPSYAVISDYFPPAERGRALAIFSLGVPFGIAVGAALGGGVAAAYGWRAAFYAVGLPGVVIALLILTMVREPIRGIQDGAAGRIAAAPLGEVFRLFFSNSVLVWTALATGLGAFAGYGSSNWTPAFLMRHQHMTLGQLAAYYSVSVGAAVGLGTWLSGYLADRLSRGNPRAYAMIPFWGSLVALPLAIAGYVAPNWQISLTCLTISAAFGILYLAPALAIVQNTVPPQARSTSAAILLLILNLIGLGGGPVFVGVLSDFFKPHFGANSLQAALLCSAPVLLLVMGACLMAARALGRTQAARHFR